MCDGGLILDYFIDNPPWIALTSIHRPYCSFVRWDGDLCRQHRTTAVQTWLVLKTAYGSLLTNPTKWLPENAKAEEVKQSSRAVSNEKWETQRLIFLYTRRKNESTKMALSRRRTHYVIGVDCFILRRCCVLSVRYIWTVTESFVIRKLYNQYHCCYIWSLFVLNVIQLNKI